MSMCKDLEIEQANLDARGIRDIKFFIDPFAEKITREELCESMVQLLKAHRLGKCKPLQLIGDRLLTHIGDKS